MILVDYSNIMHRAVHVKLDLNLSNLRHVILTQILTLIKKFGKDYGRIVICLDGQDNWRYKEFPEYNAPRKEKRKVSKIDWSQVYEWSAVIEKELADYFPFQVIKNKIALADDIIAYIAMHKGKLPLERTLIASSDVDFNQLLVDTSVKQYSFHSKKMIHTDTPLQDLVEGVVRGQGGKDGIPNILSPVDSFVTKVRQKPIKQDFIAKVRTSNPESFCESDTILARYKQNRLLIDMRYIPSYVLDEIKTSYDESYDYLKNTKRPKLYKYFIQKGLRGFTGSIKYFMNGK